MQATPNIISSRENPRFKEWRRFVTQPEASDCPWVAVEGWRAVADVAALRPVEALLFSDSNDSRLAPLLERSRAVFQLPARRLRELSQVETSAGVLAFFEKPRWSQQQLPEFLLYLERLRDPGNLGTLLRTACAFDGGLVTSPGSVSFFNGKVVRATAATLFRTPFLAGIEIASLIDWGYRCIAATPSSGGPLPEHTFERPCAVLIGSEGGGLSDEALTYCQERIRIPMIEGAESLNAAIAGALILYEAFRGTR